MEKLINANYESKSEDFFSFEELSNKEIYVYMFLLDHAEINGNLPLTVNL